jgi:hypothetical protein
MICRFLLVDDEKAGLGRLENRPGKLLALLEMDHPPLQAGDLGFECADFRILFLLRVVLFTHFPCLPV